MRGVVVCGFTASYFDSFGAKCLRTCVRVHAARLYNFSPVGKCFGGPRGRSLKVIRLFVVLVDGLI